jgi:murein DD-endopeptidase MepM/ murein hydrolase activator NlpD
VLAADEGVQHAQSARVRQEVLEMNIIFFNRKHNRPIRLQLNAKIIGSAAIGLFVLASSIGATGYWAYNKLTASPVSQLSAADRAQQEELAAMAARMADIQARMMRIDALGAHLAESAKVKGDEFDFTRKPPMGGPENPIQLPDSPADIDKSLSTLSTELELREAQLLALDKVLQNRRQQVDLNNMPVRDAYISSNYGYRADPMTGRTAFHAGIDFAGTEGSDVFSVADGVVTFAGKRTGYGNVVEVNHGDGLVTRYAHARAVAVKVGDMVSKDQLVAYMGSTGRSTGTHLHYEVLRNGKQIDPTSFIRVAKR